jgi:hypothetical protein
VDELGYELLNDVQGDHEKEHREQQVLQLLEMFGEYQKEEPMERAY